MQGSIQRAAHGVDPVHALNGFKRLFGRDQPHRHMDAPNDEHAFLRFNLASHFPHELPVARIDVTRIQRASESTEHSTGGRGDHVVNRRGVRLRKLGRVDLVVLGYRSVNAEQHGFGFTRQVSDPNRSNFPLNTSFRNVHYIGRGCLLWWSGQYKCRRSICAECPPEPAAGRAAELVIASAREPRLEDNKSFCRKPGSPAFR